MIRSERSGSYAVLLGPPFGTVHGPRGGDGHSRSGRRRQPVGPQPGRDAVERRRGGRRSQERSSPDGDARARPAALGGHSCAPRRRPCRRGPSTGTRPWRAPPSGAAPPGAWSALVASRPRKSAWPYAAELIRDQPGYVLPAQFSRAARRSGGSPSRAARRLVPTWRGCARQGGPTMGAARRRPVAHAGGGVADLGGNAVQADDDATCSACHYSNWPSARTLPSLSLNQAPLL
jgi:hypothetical protein